MMKGDFRHFGATLAPKRKKLHLGECRPCVSFMYTRITTFLGLLQARFAKSTNRQNPTAIHDRG